MLDTLKMLLDITDNDLDKKLQWILETTTARLKSRLGGLNPPESMNYIIVEVSVKRFNKIGSEGVDIHIVEGENQHYEKNLFEEFEDDIERYLKSNTETGQRRVRFL